MHSKLILILSHLLYKCTKNRLEDFFENLSNKDSRISQAFKLVSKGAQKAQKLAEAYNKFAPYFVLSPVPGIFLAEKVEQ